MSRHCFNLLALGEPPQVILRDDSEPRPGELVLVLGWDRPLGTFFAQLVRGATADDEDHVMELWIGDAPGEIPSIRDLALRLTGVADLGLPTYAMLERDRVRESAR